MLIKLMGQVQLDTISETGPVVQNILRENKHLAPQNSGLPNFHRNIDINKPTWFIYIVCLGALESSFNWELFPENI